MTADVTVSPLPGSARPSRSGVSVRTRITASVALLVALALTGAGAIVFVIESQRIDEQLSDEIDQEFGEFAQLQPERFDTVEQMMRTFLGRNVPDDTESLVGWWADDAQLSSPADQVVDTDAFREATAPLIADNGSTTLETAQGPVLINVQSVTIASTGEVGALVIVTYLDRSRAGLLDTMRTYAVVALLLLLLVTALAGWLSGRLLRPLRALRETTEEIGESDLSLRLPVTGNDDITALTRTVNSMLDRLEAAFVGQRQFLDDAGHELKTPLTVLRGHLELLDVGSAAEVAETKDLLLDEVDRMARLVGDLILLAKSDRPDFVTFAEVDLGDLTEDLLAKARGLGDRRWELDGRAAVTVRVDEQRITQAVLQLADNAVKHTAPGDRVAVGSSYDGLVGRLWVRDEGPGVPEADRRQIFERFGRSSVPEGDEGFGLGLSIVGAITEAHGGTVSVETVEPHGAHFVMTLPVDRHQVSPTQPPTQPPSQESAWPAS